MSEAGKSDNAGGAGSSESQGKGLAIVLRVASSFTVANIIHPLFPSSLLAMILSSNHCPAVAPLTDPTTGEERTPLQSRSKNRPPPPAHPSTPFSNQTYHPTSSEISFNQQVVYLNFFGPSSSHPSPQPNPLTLHPPSADTQDTSALGV